LNGKSSIAIDYSHNNFLTLESSSFGEFTQFLFTSGYKLGKIETGFNALDNIEKYNVIILSTPRNTSLKQIEIETLEKYVKNGGSLLIVSSTGGDYTNSTNLNDLTQKFGFEFVSDEVYDSVNYVNLQKRPIITKFKPHVITEQLKKIVFSSSCSIKILDFLEDEKNIKVEWLLQSGLNGWRKRYDGESWIEEDSPKIPLMVVVEYFKGKVVGFGNLSIFSSLTREYGFSTFDNDILIANILSFLMGSLDSEGKPVTIELNLDLYYWAEDVVKQENWESVSDLINVSLKYFKDNYGEIIKEIKKLRLERLEKKKAYEKAIKEKKKEKIVEEKVIDKVPVLVRKKEDLEEIMDALEDITGEKYEITIDLNEEKEISAHKSSLGFTDEDINEFEKSNPKKAIWHGKPTKAFKEWLENKNKS
jgi:Arc/MetJ-type ribon-helix-helix transcriptional regulator